MVEADSETHTYDCVAHLPSASRCGYVLYYLMKNRRGTIDELSKRLTLWEAETTNDDVSKGDRERIAISLVHNHLPRLADHNIIEYDQRSGDIVLIAPSTELASLAERSSLFESEGKA